MLFNTSWRSKALAALSAILSLSNFDPAPAKAQNACCDGKIIAWTGAGSDQSWSNPDNWQGGVVPNGDNFAYIYHSGPSKVGNSSQGYNTDNQYTCGNLAGIGYIGNETKFPIVDANVTVRGIYLLGKMEIVAGRTLTVHESMVGSGSLLPQTGTAPGSINFKKRPGSCTARACTLRINTVYIQDLTVDNNLGLYTSSGMAGVGERQIRVYGELKIKSGFLDVRNTTAFTTNGSIFYLWGNAARIAEITSADSDPIRHATPAVDGNGYYTANPELAPFRMARSLPSTYGLSGSSMITITPANRTNSNYKGFWDLVAPALTHQRIGVEPGYYSGGTFLQGPAAFAAHPTQGVQYDCGGDVTLDAEGYSGTFNYCRDNSLITESFTNISTNVVEYRNTQAAVNTNSGSFPSMGWYHPNYIYDHSSAIFRSKGTPWPTGMGVRTFLIRRSSHNSGVYVNDQTNTNLITYASGSPRVGDVRVPENTSAYLPYCTGTCPGAPDPGFTSQNTSGNGWNLVGNPYASPINLKLATYSGCYSTIYKWDVANQVYVAVDLSTASDADATINTGEAFFVEVNTSTASVTFHESDKVAVTGSLNSFRTAPDTKDGKGKGASRPAEMERLVYPNPIGAGEMLNINSTESLDTAEYAITDATGREVARGKCQGSAVRLPKTIKAGLYNLTTLEGGRTVSVQFAVK